MTNKFFTEFFLILPNCPVGATVAVDKYVNTSIYPFGFLDFLCFTSDLYILGSLKCSMTSRSIESIDTTNLFLPHLCFCEYRFAFCFSCICKT